MNIKVIGVGAAGNKSTIELLKSELIIPEKVLLLNSTLRDIPSEYRSLAITYNDTLGGCGKERNLAKELCLKALENGRLNVLDGFVDPNDDYIVIVNSTEGGTGCGSSVILANYFKDVIGIPVMIFGFTGFEEDGRGLQNTIEFFQDLNEDYIVQSISNKKFLDEAMGNKLKAEKLANKEFVNRISVLLTKGVIDSNQNIDHTDMLKVSTTSGYMTIDSSILKIKNIDQFNKTITKMLDEDKSLDINEKSQKRLAVFLNIKEETSDFVDYQFEILKERLGIPYEIFTNVQYNEEYPESISIVSSGIKMPIDEIKEIYKKYKEQSEKVNKRKDDFFKFASELKGNEDDSMFNLSKNSIKKDKKSFFEKFKNNQQQNNNENKKEESDAQPMSKEDFIKTNY